MARNSRRSNGMKKLQPAPQTLSFATTVPAGATVDLFIDISQAASLVNRRFYRQGLNWAVSGIKFLSQSSAPLNGSIVIEKLPETWVMFNSWEKGFRAWQRMIREATSEADTIRPKFLDFKIYADSDHHNAGTLANLLPVSGAGVPASPGEWDYSTFEIPLSNVDASAVGGNSVTRDVIATGASYTAPGASGNLAVSLIEGYASSRALPDIEDPNMPDDASDAGGSLAENWMTALFNEGNQQDSEIIQDLETQNNIAPYPFENDGVNVDTMYPGGANQLAGLQIHSSEYVTGTTVGGTTRFKGGMFPCGLIGLRLTNYNTEFSLAHVIELDLVPGTHRGYLATPMTEM